MKCTVILQYFYFTALKCWLFGAAERPKAKAKLVPKATDPHRSQQVTTNI